MDFIEQPTETALISWRFGQAFSERLCASVLHSEGYKRVDPQAPLGGADGIKDIVFDLNGWDYIAACYFPSSPKEFSEIKDKFKGDLEGVSKNGADGIAFFTGQKLTIEEREQLKALAEAEGARVIFYHSEALRAILDSPRGYGMRLEFLRIPMKPEEQASFVSQFGSDLSAALNQNSGLLAQIAEDVSCLRKALLPPVEGTPSYPTYTSNIAATYATRALSAELITSSDKSNVIAKSSFITRHLDVELLKYIHRSMMDEAPPSVPTGELRPVGVWIGAPGSTPESARYVPPSPDEVPALVTALLDSWRANYETALSESEGEKIDRLVAFHHEFLRIHPFLDGNGRIARLILEQQARELLNIDRKVFISDSAAYFQALQQAHQGDLSQLKQIVTQAITGSWPLDSGDTAVESSGPDTTEQAV